MEKFHVITGLPRSGTTLISTILKQNPRFEASISNPLARMTRAIVQESNAQVGYRHECPPEKTQYLVKSLVQNYYDYTDKPVAFNTNRGWGLQLPLLKKIYPNLKVIMCVRDIGWILDSFERLIRQNPFNQSGLFPPENNVSVYTRCNYLLQPNQVLGFAYQCTKEALFSEYKNSILVIDYPLLAKDPQQVVSKIYQFIGEELYSHDFDAVEADYPEYDEDLQLPGLHKVRKTVSYQERTSIIPYDIWESVKGMEFWKAA